MRNKLGYKSNLPCQEKKERNRKKCYNETRKRKKEKKEDHVNDKREITIEGKEKVEKAKQLI